MRGPIIDFVYSPEYREWEDPVERERRQRRGLIRMALIAAIPGMIGFVSILIYGK